ncbi:MAG TPA: hypothetical protein VFY90_00680 [Tepidiformaceae bacterium]|nr:hypothetical protein [Tepidiformaceae bacterium]
MAAQTAPDSTTAVPPSAPDSSATVPEAAVVPSPEPDSSATVPSSTLPITVVLKDGTEHHYVRVERSGSYLIAWRLDGGTDNIRVNKIDRILGDQTSDVLKEGVTAGKQKEKKNKASGKPLLRGQPLPEMKLFLMVQAGALVRADSHTEYEEDGHGWLEVGGMKNISPRYALGGTLGVADDGQSYTRITVKPRLRTWLGRGYAIDIAPGVFFPTGQAKISTFPESRLGSVGFTAELAFVASDWAAVSYVVEAIDAEKVYYAPGLYTPFTSTSETEVFHYIGLKAGGAVGLFLGVLTFVGLFANN